MPRSLWAGVGPCAKQAAAVDSTVSICVTDARCRWRMSRPLWGRHPSVYHCDICTNRVSTPPLDDVLYKLTALVRGILINFKAPFTRYNRLSNPLSIRLYNPVWQPVERTAVRSTRLSNRLSNPFDNWFDNRLDVCLHDTAGCQTGCATIWQPAVSCIRGLSHQQKTTIAFSAMTDVNGKGCGANAMW